MLDVLILGSGPAGCAAALSLSRLEAGLRIGLHADPAPPDMTQTLAPGVRGLFQQLGCIPTGS